MAEVPASPSGLPLAPAAPPDARRAWLACALLAAAALLAYANTLPAPLIFDDHPAITENASIRRFSTALSPPADGRGVTGRPVVNLSFALNFAAGGLDVRGYHATNLAIHLLAGLALLGVLRRTLQQPPLRARFGAASLPLATAAALAWTLHPLQTESVTCLAQRTESLVGLCYLATFYAFVRALEPGAARRWRVLAVVACLAGMATKEVMVTAPVLLLLYDRTFVAGSFAEAWRRRKTFHLALAATWLLLAWLVLGQAGSRGNSEGAALVPTVFSYALTQCGAIIRYLGLALWPHPLVLDYDTRLVRDVSEVLLPGTVLLALLAATVLALRRRPVWGFAGAWCFGLLGPSSSFVPLLPQPIAEHRMYLPLAAVITVVLASAFHLAGRRVWLVAAALALALGVTTARRNHDYRSAEAIWRDTVAKQPTNARAHFYLGHALEEAGRLPAAVAAYEAALALHPAYAEAHGNLGRLLGRTGRVPDALRHLEAAVRANPRLLTAQKNLGLYLPFAGRGAEAIPILENVLAAHPDDADAHTWLGDALLGQNRPAAAVPHYAAAVRLQPDSDKAESNWGAACLLLGQPADARRHLERALRLQPANLAARRNLGLVALQQGRPAEAADHFAAVLRANPDDPVAREQLDQLRRSPALQP